MAVGALHSASAMAPRVTYFASRHAVSRTFGVVCGIRYFLAAKGAEKGTV
jgi:hypothetical protein